MKEMRVAVDGSECSLAALKAAAKLADERGIEKVALLNAIPTTRTPVGPLPAASVTRGFRPSRPFYWAASLTG